MLLRVEFSDFPKTAKEFASSTHAFVTGQGKQCVVTSADVSKNLVVIAESDIDTGQTVDVLRSIGMTTQLGNWSLDSLSSMGSDYRHELFLAIVAYVSKEDSPGIWVDAYPHEPTEAQVIKAIYDEFIEHGEIPEDVTLDDFVTLGKPNVLILSPPEYRRLAEDKI